MVAATVFPCFCGSGNLNLIDYSWRLVYDVIDPRGDKTIAQITVLGKWTRLTSKMNGCDELHLSFRVRLRTRLVDKRQLLPPNQVLCLPIVLLAFFGPSLGIIMTILSTA